jgi:hypothetical protein
LSAKRYCGRGGPYPANRERKQELQGSRVRGKQSGFRTVKISHYTKAEQSILYYLCLIPNADPQFECGFLFPYPPLWTYKPFVTSDEGDDDKDNGKGGGNDNNHHSSMDMGSNRDMGIGICRNRGRGNNMVQDRVAYWGAAQL